MGLCDDLVDSYVGGRAVVVFQGCYKQIGKRVIRFQRERALDCAGRGRPERVRRDFNALATPHLFLRFHNLRVAKVEREAELLALRHQVIAAPGCAHARVIERELLAVFHQKSLKVTGREHLEFGRGGLDDDGTAVVHRHLNVGGTRGRRSSLLRRRNARTAESYQQKQNNSANRLITHLYLLNDKLQTPQGLTTGNTKLTRWNLPALC